MTDFSRLCTTIGGKMVMGACRVSSEHIDFLIKPVKKKVEIGIKDKKVVINDRDLLSERPYPGSLKPSEVIEIETGRGIILAGPHTPLFYDDKSKLKPITEEIWKKIEQKRVEKNQLIG